MKTIYLQKITSPGYGDRLYVPYKHIPEIEQVLNAGSLWGGADKDTGRCKSWEYPNGRPHVLIHTCETLRRMGFNISPLTAQVSNEVW